MYQPVYKYFKTVANNSKVTTWESKRLYDDSIETLSTSNNSLGIDCINNTKLRKKIDGNCLK